MTSISPDMLSAMNDWDFTLLKNKIIDLNLKGPETIRELVAYLDQKHAKEDTSLEIGLGEMARPVNKKMLFFNNTEAHAYVRLRLSTRRGRIEDQDSIPISLKLNESDVNCIKVRVRTTTSKLSTIKSCEGHNEKFRTRVRIKSDFIIYSFHT